MGTINTFDANLDVNSDHTSLKANPLKPLLEIQKLKIYFQRGMESNEVVKEVNFKIYEKETFALLGESGAGKSITAYSILQLLPRNVLLGREAKILFNDIEQSYDLLTLPPKIIRQIRGQKIAMVFQEPMTSLNPVLTIGNQIGECLSDKFSNNDAKKNQMLYLLDAVKISNAKQVARSYPHELSGGMRQRVMLAMAVARSPKLLILDEPTTALDVTTQKQIIQLLLELQKELGMSLLFITHDILLAERISNTAGIMEKGYLIEKGPTAQLLTNPQESYSQKLIFAEPKQQTLPTINNEKQILSVQNLNVFFPIRGGLLRRTVAVKKAVIDVSFRLHPGETLAIAGESGSGKTTLAKTMMELISPTSGQIIFYDDQGNSIAQNSLQRKKDIQIIFQDPFSSLDPRWRVGDLISEGMLALKIYHKSKVESKVDALLDQVALPQSYKNRFPHQLSGGERQRVCIARALSLKPRLLVLDEPTSSLDVSIQAQIIDLLLQLQREHNFTYLLITHNLNIVKIMAHRIGIMKAGEIIELGETQTVLQNPSQPYTQELIKAALLLYN